MKQSEYDIMSTNPDLDEVLFWPFLKKNPVSSLKFLFKLRKEKFDLSILPCPSNRIQYNVISTICGARNRAGFHYLRQSRQNLDFLNNILIQHIDHIHNVQHNVLLIEKLGMASRHFFEKWSNQLVLKTTPSDVEQASRFLNMLWLDNTDFIALHISSSRAKHMERKCWPKESFLELIKRLTIKHPELKFLIICGDEDAYESDWLMQNGGYNVHIVRDKPIRVIAEILKKSKLLITSDSGLLHVACAINVPSVAIFGPTNPRRSGPLNAKSKVVRNELPCSPCFYHTSKELSCDAGLNFQCIRELPVEKVIEATTQYL